MHIKCTLRPNQLRRACDVKGCGIVTLKRSQRHTELEAEIVGLYDKCLLLLKINHSIYTGEFYRGTRPSKAVLKTLIKYIHEKQII